MTTVVTLRFGPTSAGGGVPPRLLALLSVLAVVGPVSMDLYLPTLPDVAADLGLGAAQESWSLLGCLGGLAVGQVVWGPVADRIGRRRAVLGGLVAWILVTAGCALAGGAVVFLPLRVLQGLAGACGLTVSRAVLADLLPPERLRRPLARLMILTSVFTVLSPVLGGLLLTVMPWRGIFWLLAAAGVLTLLASLLLLPESSRAARPTAEPKAAPLGSGFALATLTAGLAFATIIIYVTASPTVLRGGYGLGGLQFGLVFAITAVAMAGGAQLAPTLAGRAGAGRTGLIGLGLSVVFCLVLALLALADGGAPPLALVVVLLVLANAATGSAMPLAAAEAMAGGGGRKGTASGLVGGIQFGLGALVSAALTPWHPGAVLPVALAMTGSAAATTVAWSLWRRRDKRDQQARELRDLTAEPVVVGTVNASAASP